MAARPFLSFASLLYAAELTNLGWATAGWQLALARFCFGVVGNLANISVNTQGVLVERIYGRPIMTSFHGVWSMSGFTGALFGYLMMNLRLTSPAFFVVAGLVFTIALTARPYLVSGSSQPAEKRKFSRVPKACWSNSV